ncbi:DUF2958 domain-containing protein [Nocardioides sp. InS609-2]|uniref:DUF2958 domain-containing protein n=1 Tax=Nocardioides sp. InS609-2 TaxID=2760705 RepID=UPI0020BD6668|nr:DUF2958 domain-containing protein [Nocardioides sp. InS609-2]
MNADDLRGHDFYPSEDVLDTIPRLYATEDTSLWEKTVHLHYFVGACDWYIAELGEDRRIAFGYVNMGDPQNAEWGYIDLVELRQIVVDTRHGFSVVVERDLHWTPTVFGDVNDRRVR